MRAPGVERAGMLVSLAWASVRRRALPSILTVLAVALGVALVVAVDTVRTSADRSFTEAARGYDVVLGPAHGSPLQTVLSTLFHVDEPAGVLPWSAYEAARDDPRVRVAVPYAMGDTYRGRRVIGTSRDLFETLVDANRVAIGEHVVGRLFEGGRFEAVVGAVVAESTGLALGHSFQVSHGLVEGGHVHDERWTVVGVLRPTGTPHDRAIYIPIETFYAIPGHDVQAPGTTAAGEGHGDDHDEGDAHDHDHHEGDAHDHDHHEGDAHDHDHHEGDAHDHDEGDAHDHDEEHAEHDAGHADHADHAGHGSALSSVGIRLKSPALRLAFLHEFRTTRTDAQAILPADQVRNLLTVVGDVNRAVTWIAWLVTGVAGLTILVGLYNTIHGRRREIAVLRALGARPGHVFVVILLEALLLCFFGGVLGLLLGHGGVAAASPMLLEAYGVRAEVLPGAQDLQILGAVLVLGFLAGLLPAWRGLITPVAEGLEAEG